VIEAGDELRLAHETSGVARVAAVQELERDDAARLLIERFPHRAHAAGSGQTLDAEPTADDVAAAHWGEV